MFRLLAQQQITILHKSGQEYQFILSQVSCHETTGVKTAANGFSEASTSGICIFWGCSRLGTRDAKSAYVSSAAFSDLDASVKAQHWTVAVEDRVLLPSGRKGRVQQVQDNTTGRFPHIYLEVV